MLIFLSLTQSSSQSINRPNLDYSTCSSSSSSSSSSYSLFSFKPINKRFDFLNPACSSSLKQPKKQQRTLQTNNPPQSSFKKLLNLNNNDNNNNNNPNDNGDDDDDDDNGATIKGTVLAGLLLVGFVGGFGSVGYIYRDQINALLIQFSTFIEGGTNQLLTLGVGLLATALAATYVTRLAKDAMKDIDE